jgi:hypothetical protein
MKEKQKEIISVNIPKYEYRFVVAKASRKTGRPRYWTVNGQGLYNATLHFTLRGKITKYYHKYLIKYINQQLSVLDKATINKHVYPGSGSKLSISCDIYEIRRNKIPDIMNMWLWTKWFEDALQETGVIPDDNPDYVIESGRTRYHWVDSEKERQLLFNIEIINV